MSRPAPTRSARSEEHTSELQSPKDLVCRLLLEKNKNHHNLSRPRPTACRRRTAPTATHGRARGGAVRCGGPLCCGRCTPVVCSFFFFKGAGAPRLIPFSPRGPPSD